MKKRKFIKILMLLSCLLIGCSSKKEKDVIKTNDIQYIGSSNSITDTALVSSDNGISYTDFANGTKVYACNQLDCTHQPDSKCLAYSDEKNEEGLFVYPFLYNDKLYYFDERHEETLLIASLADGSEKEVLAEQEGSVLGVDVLRVGSKLYYWGVVEERESTEDGYIDILSAESEIYEADIESGDIKQLSSFGSNYNSALSNLIYSDGYIYFSYSKQQTSWQDTPYAHPGDRLAALDELSIDEYKEMLDIQDVMGRINVDSGQEELYPVSSSESIGIIGVTEKKIFIFTENEEELVYYDKGWENRTVLYPAQMMENGSSHAYEFIDGQLIISVFESYENPPEYHIWDDEQNEFRKMDYNLDYGISFIRSSENKLLIAQTPLKESTTEDEWDFILADKESFFQGELVYIEAKIKTQEAQQLEEEEQEEQEEQNEELNLTMKELKETYPDKEILLWAYDATMQITPAQNRALNSVLVDKGYEFVIFLEAVAIPTFEASIDSMVNGENPPDIICGGMGEAGTLQGTYRAIKKEWLLELDPYLDTEEGKALKDTYPENMWKSFDINGSIYGVNGMLPLSTDFVYFVNQELADKYNISIEELANLKPSELGPVLDQVYQGEKSKDFITFIHDEDYQGYYSQVSDQLNNACNAIVVDNRIKKPEVVNIYTEDDSIKYFTSLASYRKSGYLDVDKKQLDVGEKNDPENFFIIQGYDDVFGHLGEELQDSIKEDYQKVSKVTVVPFAPCYITVQGNGVAGVCSNSKNKELAFKALSAVYSQKDLSDILLYGVEGVDYELIADKVTSEELKWIWYRSLFFGNPVVSTAYNEEPINKKEIIFDKIGQMLVTDTVGTYIELDDITDDINEINSIINEYNGLFNGKFSNVEDTIQELNSRLEDVNFQSLLDEIEQRYISARE